MKKIAAIALLITAALTASANCQTSLPFTLRGTVGVQGFMPGPVRTTADASWRQLDQVFHVEACMLWVDTYGAVDIYGTPTPNGYYEFNGARSLSGTLGNWCISIPEATRICLDGTYLSTPDFFGQHYVVRSARICW